MMQQQVVYQALADPTRREILRLLKGGARSAGELAEGFPISRASLSHHFSLLKAAGLVHTRREGQRIIYALNLSVLEEVTALVMNLLDVGTEDSEETSE